MISFNQLIFFGIIELIIGFALGWFVRGPRRGASATAPPVSQATPQMAVPATGAPGAVLTDIASLVEQHAKCVESFQASIEQTKGQAAGDIALSTQISELQDANRTFDEGVEGKVAQLASASEPALKDVAGSINGHCDKSKSLDDLLGQIDSNATPEELKEMLSGALADVLDSKQQLESELSDVREKLEEKTVRLSAAEQDARVDTLTRLPNRRAFEEQVAAAHALFERQQQMYALLMFDIDHFKSFNDTHGHAAGDSVLQTVARVLLEKKRVSDQSFRLGGEEFVMLLRSASSSEAFIAAERMRKAIEETVVIFEGQNLKVTTSVGVADVEGGLSPEQVLERADMALYVAKENGRNQAHVHGNEPQPQTAAQSEVAEPVGAAGS